MFFIFEFSFDTERNNLFMERQNYRNKAILVLMENEILFKKQKPTHESSLVFTLDP